MEPKKRWSEPFEDIVEHAYAVPLGQSIPQRPYILSRISTDSDDTLHIEKEGFLASDEPLPLRAHKSYIITKYDICMLSLIFGMLLWPWVFLTVVAYRGGIEMDDDLAEYIIDHPQAMSFILTLIGSIACFIVNVLFGIAITRFGQEWIKDTDRILVFDVSLLTAFRYQNWPWSLSDLKHMFVRRRWLRVLLVAICISTFAFVPSSTTSLITPVHFNRTLAVSGRELDFSSDLPECTLWYSNHTIKNNCDWHVYKGLVYTTCLVENQLEDVLEAGRSNTRSFAFDKPQSHILSQLGTENGLNFLGPTHGVLPMGPNGVPALDPVEPSQFPERPYNYTFDQQGFASTVHCDYEPSVPITVGRVDSSTWILQYNGVCDDAVDFLTLSGVKTYMAVNTNNSLAFWACKTLSDAAEGPSYSIYLRGRKNYEGPIGNLTCAVSPIQPAIFPVTYRSVPGTFTSDAAISTSPTTFNGFVDAAVMGVGALVSESQNFQANLVAESVITTGVRSIDLTPYDPSETYLRLYESFLQGVIDYELTYTRLIYSTIENTPASCYRTVNGTLSYDAFGWHTSNKQVGFLLPMTALNLASFVILFGAIFAVVRRGERGPEFDPTDTNSLIMATHTPADDDPDEWADKVVYHPRDMIKRVEGAVKRHYDNDFHFKSVA